VNFFAFFAALVVICFPVLSLVGFNIARACLYDLACSQSWGAVVRHSPGFARCYFDFSDVSSQYPPGASLIFHVNTFHAVEFCPNLQQLGHRIIDLFTFDHRYVGADHGLAVRLGLSIYATFVIVECAFLAVGCAAGNLMCRLILRPSYWSLGCTYGYRRRVYLGAMFSSVMLAAATTPFAAAALLLMFPSEHYGCLPGLVSPGWFGMGVLLGIPGLLVTPLTLRVHARRIGGAVTLYNARCGCDYPCAPGHRCPECGRVAPGFPARLVWRWRV